MVVRFVDCRVGAGAACRDGCDAVARRVTVGVRAVGSARLCACLVCRVGTEVVFRVRCVVVARVVRVAATWFVRTG